MQNREGSEDLENLNQRFEFDESIGSGGLGQVFRANDTQLQRWVAIKRLHGGAGRDEGRMQAAIQEAKNLAVLQHPNIVTIYDFVEQGDDVLVVMEYINGHTLQYLAEHTPLALADFFLLAQQSLEGLIAAHSLGMIHRDIKPANIMLAELPSGSFQVKLLDFGMAKVISAPSLQTMPQEGAVMGSVFTMAPEQFEQQPLDPRTDLYSLGCCFYYAVTSKFPFQGETATDIILAHLQHRFLPLKQARPDFPPAVCQWIEQLMALKAEDRPASAVQALGDLKKLSHLASATKPVGTRPTLSAPSRPQVVRKPPQSAAPEKKSLLPGILLGVGACLLLAGGAWFFWSDVSSDAEVDQPRPAPVPKSVQNPPASTQIIAPSNRAALIQADGKVVSVRGEIGRFGQNRNETVFYLNFVQAGLNDLSLVFFASDHASGPFAKDGLQKLIGKTVQVTGEIQLYKGNPQIIIRDTSQLRVE